MGNCLRNNKVSAQDHDNYETPLEPPSDEAKVEQQINASSLSKLEAPVQQEQSLKKKVRFKLQNDDEGDRVSHSNSRSGTVRIKVVITQEELKRILSCNNDAQHTSLEQLLSAVKLRGRRISEVREYDGGIHSWSPALESIPEDRLMK